jgi:hypothetical protein
VTGDPVIKYGDTVTGGPVIRYGDTVTGNPVFRYGDTVMGVPLSDTYIFIMVLIFRTLHCKLNGYLYGKNQYIKNMYFNSRFRDIDQESSVIILLMPFPPMYVDKANTL